MPAWLALGRHGAHGPAGTVVLELGDARVRVLRASLDGARPRIDAAATIAGQAPRDALARLSREGWFAAGRVRVMLGASQRDTAILPRPDVEDAELVDAMRWQMADKLPYPAERAAIDVLTVDDHEPATRRHVIVVAADRDALRGLLGPVVATRRRRVEWVDVADCAQRNLVEAACGAAACVACVTERDGALLFTISRGRDLVFSRVIEVAPDGRDDTLAVERMGLQLQRAIDTIERRSPESAPVRMLVGPPPSAHSPLRAVAEQCGLPVAPLEWDAGAEIAPAARADIDADPDLVLLVGAALRHADPEALRG
jgi:MSHA biogenesis protein MshI